MIEDEPDWHLLEKGEIDVATYFSRLSGRAPAILGTNIDMDAYGRFWRSSSPGVHWMVVHKIQELKHRGIRLGLLTNNVKEFGEHWRTMFPLDELCDEVVDSSHVGMRKPDREIYDLTCTRMGITPEEAVFIDDNADNIAAARAYGMEVVHFQENPWDALGAPTRFSNAAACGVCVAGSYAPLSVISLRKTVMPATEPGRNVRSEPMSARSSSMRCSVDATVTSRTGSANSPLRTMRPSAPTEKSPLTGFVPECSPLTDCT